MGHILFFCKGQAKRDRSRAAPSSGAAAVHLRLQLRRRETCGPDPVFRPADIFGSKNAPKDNVVKDIAIVYQPKVLRSMREICEEMGVGEAVVKRWIAEGAPVAVEGQGRRRRYSAEMLMLQAWRVSSGGPPCRNIRQPCGNGPHPAGNDAGRFFRLS